MERIFFILISCRNQNGFEYYCQQFKTLELTSHSIAFLNFLSYRTGIRKVLSGFWFSVKAPRLITHFKQFNDTEKLLADFYSTVRQGLENKLGAILFQLPPQGHFTEESFTTKHLSP
jgi:uncharacterized protein YecE (DUF72 family)